MDESKNKSSSFAFKGMIPYIFYALLCAVSAVCVLLSVIVVSIANGATTENTVGLFGYKIYTCNQNVENTDIEKGSLVIIKNTDNDEFYTPQMLKEKAIVLKNMGAVIKGYSTYIAVVLMLPAISFFAVVLMREISKKVIKNEHKKMQTELDFSEIDTFEIDEETAKK